MMTFHSFEIERSASMPVAPSAKGAITPVLHGRHGDRPWLALAVALRNLQAIEATGGWR
jgi:hypothetical protein